MLDQLVKKRLVEKEKGSGDKNSIENRYKNYTNYIATGEGQNKKRKFILLLL